ncbi:DUF2441 domain-containing protein [Promethearchaeum syntrophicum]|uniref:DUF2441 domain-containing protein n=1 Tax=Promethearchaeum syntrophicum TaxID=2594042 RepID=A0A5B9D995_9ARCH|nr:DUF2441 domain-containing protein [Candidatus Prometheoarchaeum syntrophicum]QEE15417.1 hypothetical protein DSAG12_01242 [Candidatus Prometheoarchaeum syntrophicum]
MQVNNKIYYHIQRKDPNQPYWNIGEVLTGPAGPKNYFIESVLNQEYSRYAGEGLYWDSDILSHYAAVQMGFETKFSKMDNSYFNPEGILRMSYTMINHYLRVLRELIFETVREKSFPHLISRWGCIWLIPSKKGIGFWIKKLGIADLSQCRIYKVKCTGEIHRGHEKHLQVESMSVPNFEENAIKYWTGGGKDSSYNDEVIFWGNVEFIEIIDY